MTRPGPKTSSPRARTTQRTPVGVGKAARARGLEQSAIVAAALMEMDEHGEGGFSIRRVAARLECDPMAVLYHVGSREALERAVADTLNAKVGLPDPSLGWRARLSALADAYRELAHRHPRAFPLLLRFWSTGPSDYAIAEAVYAALGEAGFDPDAAVDYGCGFYASLLGFCIGEVRGLLVPLPPAYVRAEVEALSEASYPALRRLASAFTARDPEILWLRTRDALLDGIEANIGRHRTLFKEARNSVHLTGTAIDENS